MSKSRKIWVIGGVVFLLVVLLFLYQSGIFMTFQAITFGGRDNGETCSGDSHCSSGTCESTFGICCDSKNGCKGISNHAQCQLKCAGVPIDPDITTTTIVSGYCVSSYEINGKRSWQLGEVVEANCDLATYVICGSSRNLISCNMGRPYQECTEERSDIAKDICDFSGYCRSQGSSCYTDLQCCGDLECIGNACQVGEIACRGEGYTCSKDTDCCLDLTCEGRVIKRCKSSSPPLIECDKCVDYKLCYLDSCKEYCSDECSQLPPVDEKCEFDGKIYGDGVIIKKECIKGYYIKCIDGRIITLSKKADVSEFKRICGNDIPGGCGVQMDRCDPLNPCCSSLVCEPPLDGICQVAGQTCFSEGRNCNPDNDICCASLSCVPVSLTGGIIHQCEKIGKGNQCDDDNDCDPENGLYCLPHPDIPFVKTCQERTIIDMIKEYLVIVIPTVVLGYVGYRKRKDIGRMIFFGIVGLLSGLVLYWIINLSTISRWLLGIGLTGGLVVFVYVFGGSILAFVMSKLLDR